MLVAAELDAGAVEVDAVNDMGLLLDDATAGSERDAVTFGEVALGSAVMIWARLWFFFITVPSPA